MDAEVCNGMLKLSNGINVCKHHKVLRRLASNPSITGVKYWWWYGKQGGLGAAEMEILTQSPWIKTMNLGGKVSDAIYEVLAKSQMEELTLNSIHASAISSLSNMKSLS